MEYKHIKFELIGCPQSGIVSKWLCETRDGDDLGEVHWYPPWRQYCFYPDEGTVFSADCLADIQDFLGKAKQLHAEAEAKEARNEG